jgi:threonine/homoserine/homoserine lactone efflux protein
VECRQPLENRCERRGLRGFRAHPRLARHDAALTLRVHEDSTAIANMDSHTLQVFSVLALLATATPGPTVLLALTNGSRYGVRAAIPGVVGAVLSDFVLISAVALGLGALMAGSAMLFGVVKWLGVAYLAYLGLRLLRSSGTPTAVADDAPATPTQLLMRSFLVAVSNPKGYLFFTALLPQFIVPAQPLPVQYMTLALAFAGIDAAVMLAYAFAGARVIRALQARGARWLDRLSGAAMLALAGSLALYRRSA